MSHKYRFSDWLDMYRHRHCPSLATLRRGGPQAEEHLRSCAHCRTALEHSESSAALGKLLMSLPVQQPPASPPRPGDIRALSPRRNPDSWLDEDIYHNPPLVFVLEEPDALGLIRVAQVCPETSLKDDGDVPLPHSTWPARRCAPPSGHPAAALPSQTVWAQRRPSARCCMQ